MTDQQPTFIQKHSTVLLGTVFSCLIAFGGSYTTMKTEIEKIHIEHEKDMELLRHDIKAKEELINLQVSDIRADSMEMKTIISDLNKIISNLNTTVNTLKYVVEGIRSDT